MVIRIATGSNQHGDQILGSGPLMSSVGNLVSVLYCSQVTSAKICAKDIMKASCTMRLLSHFGFLLLHCAMPSDESMFVVSIRILASINCLITLLISMW